jgi:hypothetical protein
MLGIVTVRGSACEARRGIGIMLLVFAALGEAYWAYTVPISIPSRHKQSDIIMVRDYYIFSLTLPQQRTPARARALRKKINRKNNKNYI